MANLTIKDPPAFTSEIHKTEKEELITADLENEIKSALLNNEVFLKVLTETIQETVKQHITDGTIHVTSQEKQNWSGKAGTAVATQAADGLESAADKRKLDGMAAGAEVNQNAFSNVKVGNVTVSANGKTATFTLEAGSNVTINADNASKKIVITANRDGGNADKLDGYHANHFNENISIHPPIFIRSGTYAEAILAKKKEGYQGGVIYASSYAVPDLPAGVTASWSTVIWRCSCMNAIFSIELYLDRNPVVYKGSLVDGENNNRITWVKMNDGGNADLLDGYHAEHFAAADHGHDGRYYTKTESDNLLNGKANSNHNHNGSKYLAGQGKNGGYSFTNDGLEDTGMFSDADGDLYFMQNGTKWYASHSDHTHDIAWGNISGKPSSYPPSGHDHNGVYLPYLAGLTSGYVRTGQREGFEIGRRATAEGYGTIASGDYSHAEGFSATASGDYSHAEGRGTTASGDNSHAKGSSTIASGEDSHAEGSGTTASGNDSHAEGRNTIASNYASHAMGKNSVEMVDGAYNNTIGHAFIIGNGTDSLRKSNAFSVMFNGTVKAASTITASTAADYAEFFEWLDSNPNKEDRVGHFVTLDGTKIRYANSQDEYILGIISGEPFVLGNGDCDTWNGMYVRDAFNRIVQEPAPKIVREELIEEVEREVPELNEETGEIIMKTVKETIRKDSVEKEVLDEDGNLIYEGTRPKLNPNYDPNKKYTSRFDRPEWDAVGMLGVLAVYDDGTCEVNGYCRCNDSGIATISKSGYRVIERITENIIKVVFR